MSPTPTECVDAFWSCFEAQDSPFTSVSIVAQYQVYERARAHGVKVLLGGQGGDETLMGYRKYQAFYLARLIRTRQWIGAAVQAAQLAHIALAQRRQFAAYVRRGMQYVRPATTTVLDFEASQSIPLGYAADQPLAARQLVDVYRTSLPTLLRYEDRNSMQNSIESRLPLVDFQLVELALALPDRAKLRGGLGKWILRRATRDLLPSAITSSVQKRGFDVGDAAWFSGGLGDSMRARLRDVAPRIEARLGTSLPVGYFTDERLARSPQVFAEAVTALWIGQRFN